MSFLYSHALARGPFSIYKTKPINTFKRKTVSLYDSYEEWNIHKNVHGHKIAVTNSESVQI